LHSRLLEILEEKKREVTLLRKTGLPNVVPGNKSEIRNFHNALSKPGGVNLIAEIKFASPSAGVIREQSDPLADALAIGRMYEEAGASAISLLTDKKFFGGSLDNLPPLLQAVSLPILRKDFIIDEIQVEESRLAGADAILLIVRILAKEQFRGLLAAADNLGMAVLTEIHDRADLETALECGARIIGINNRDLDTFHVDLATTLALAGHIPSGRIVVSESGIQTAEDVARVKGWGVHAVLVGTSIMKSPDPADQVRTLVSAGRR
jgi:indole-3-glycerol phosphate synthase